MLILESKNINLKKTLCPSHDGDEIRAVTCAPLRRVNWSAIFDSGATERSKQNALERRAEQNFMKMTRSGAEAACFGALRFIKILYTEYWKACKMRIPAIFIVARLFRKCYDQEWSVERNGFFKSDKVTRISESGRSRVQGKRSGARSGIYSKSQLWTKLFKENFSSDQNAIKI